MLFRNITSVELIRKYCKSNNISAYVVGGAVRDYILGVAFKDIDICIEENPMNFIEKNIKYIGDFTYYPKFQTSTIKLIGGEEFDLIRCRKEKYDKYGVLPNVIPSNIQDDLYRRDFTINSIAYDINKEEIIDIFNGLRDLKNKSIRKIHSNSYMEDPTRIFRALKYAGRYGFILEDEKEIKQNIKEGAISLISNDRIVSELESLSEEKSFNDIIDNIIKLSLMEINIEKFNNTRHQKLNKNKFYNLTRLYYILDDKIFKDILKNNGVLCKELRESFLEYDEIGDIIIKNISECKNNYDIYASIKILKPYTHFILSNVKILTYKIDMFKTLNNVKLSVKGLDIKNIGFEGKDIGEILQNLLKIKMNTRLQLEEKLIREENIGEILNVVKFKNNQF